MAYYDRAGNVITPAYHYVQWNDPNHGQGNVFCSAVQFEYIAAPGDKLDSVLASIENSDLVAVDCEGAMLGRNGTLSLLQLATGDSVYLFDVQALGQELFDRGMKRILESGTVTKVFYDCRRDSDILFHKYGVRLKSVVDLALTEVLFRYKQGMGVPRYFKGYRKCVETYLPSSDLYFHYIKEKVSNAMSTSGTAFWEERPLAIEILEYAAYDVKYLRDLHILLSSSLARGDIRAIKRGSYKLSNMTKDQGETEMPYNSPDWARVPSFFAFVGEPLSPASVPNYSPFPSPGPYGGSPYVAHQHPPLHVPSFVPMSPINVSSY